MGFRPNWTKSHVSLFEKLYLDRATSAVPRIIVIVFDHP